MLPGLAVTGSTGEVGGRVARRLAEVGVSQRLLIRDVASSPDLPGAVPVAVSDYGNYDEMAAALSGAKDLFLVSFREAEDRLQQHLTAVDAAVAAGVERIVYLSFLDASADSTFKLGRQHFATEQHIEASGVAYVFLRSSLYTDFIPFFTGDDGVIRAPAADGKVSWVCRDDIADAVVAALGDESLRANRFENTGPEALDMTETAGLLTRVTGARIRYEVETEEEAWQSRRTSGAPEWEIEGWVSSYLAIANGELALVSSDIERLTGSTPVDAETFLRRNPRIWQHLAP